MATRKALVLGAGNLPQELQAGDTIAGVEPAFSKGSLIQGSGVTLTGTLTNRLVGSGDITIAASGGGGGGASNMPTDIQNGNYTFVAGDAGRIKAKNNTTNYTYTLNNSVFAAGDVFCVGNFANSGTVTIARGSGVTLYFAGSTNDANRLVGGRGMAMVYMESASVGYVFGAGVV